MTFKQTPRLFLLLFLFLGITNTYANTKNTETTREDKSIPLAEFLDKLSEEYNVFFTYNPELVSGTILDPEKYDYNKLERIIRKLENKTRLGFEYLGNKYYVIYNKKSDTLEVKGLIANLNTSNITVDNILDNLQETVSGKVTDADGYGLAGVNIVEKGTNNGTASDFDGNYSLTVNSSSTLVFSSIGYSKKEVAVNGQSIINVTLSDGEALEEIILVGSRTAPRSSVDTPLPVDVVSSNDLISTGQASFDKALQYRIPSFNTVQTPVNDATSLLDPYEIRNMGPSRTLILINGKRKNLSALLYTQTSPGRGETGADISAIPTDAIERVEILRDGASAQYGSDAIAGVMNIILKDDVNLGSATLRSGITSEGDGEMVGIAVNNGSEIGDGKGFINYTIDLSKVNLANRPGTVDASGEVADFTGGTPADIAFVNEFLGRRPDAGNINGSPETAASKFLINGGFDLSENTELYFNTAYVYKKVNSFANYRTPYWRTVDDMPYLADFFPGENPNTAGGYDGYVPTFEGLLNDYNGTVGIKTKINDWNVDLSYTTGGNTQTYKVNQSHNPNDVASDPVWTDTDGDHVIDDGEISFSPLYRENSPQSFDPGGTRFTHNVGNIDISRLLSDKVSIGFGAEFRNEVFEVIEGGLASYDGGGADSFAGNAPQNSGKFNRYNFGGYFSLDFDVSDAFLVSGTIRTENYSDFGNTFVYKLSSRLKINEQLTARASVSSGFRAPTLHQIYTQKAQYSFIAGSGIQVGGLINNVSTQAKLLGIPELDAETSNNFTVGVGGKFDNNLSFTLDYYNIAVKDRIVLGAEIGPSGDPTNPLDILLDENNLSDISFFSNAIDTRTSGIDVVLSKRNIGLGSGQLDLNLSGNYTIQNERDGAVKDIPLVANSGQSVVNDTQEALFFTSRPVTKWILGANYDINKFGFSLNNTYFGKTTFKQQGMSNDLRTEFIPKIVTDLGINYNATEKLTIALNVNNLLNVLPEWEFKAENAAGEAILADPAQTKNQSNLITFNQRYSQMTYDGYHFSQLGTMFNLSLNYKF
ncbi:TonB-dependent receptor [Lacinutrix sp. Hel_I_90]|uniref:TonB-dependent receptor n=1 Tax=Lacinutrix sp. Hel_I_90 TaxID=1249999 RepID=UPI0009E39C73|nr:TonB-dependent receptor [Lacinutrix sp. Hel_I_90]